MDFKRLCATATPVLYRLARLTERAMERDQLQAQQLAESYPSFDITPRNRAAQEELLQDIDLALLAKDVATADEEQERLAA